MTNKTKIIVPVAGYVLITDIKETNLSSGIVLAQTEDNNQSRIGEIIDISDIKEIFEGEYMINPTFGDSQKYEIWKKIKKGTQIIYRQYAGNEIEFEGNKYRLISLDEIIAVIK